MIPSFWYSLGKKEKGIDNQQPWSEKLNIRYDIQSLSDLAVHSLCALLLYSKEGQAFPKKEKYINFLWH